MRMEERRLPSGFIFSCLIGLALIALSAGAQTTAPNEWTWMGGSSKVVPVNSSGCDCGETYYGAAGVYGTLGQPSAGNAPGSRLGAASWTDKQGNLWLFGGGGFDSNATIGLLNDLWEFQPSIGEWAWIGGSDTDPGWYGNGGVYGTLGTPAAGNIPGGRESSAVWTDSSGNLWLFGGFGADSVGFMNNLNDLWEFNPSTNEWAWMGGSSNNVSSDISGGISGDPPHQPGVYGTLGTSAPGNYPGSRVSAIGWTEDSGSLWLFGGVGWDANNVEGELNDLWEFSPSTNEWAWMSGSSLAGSNFGQPGVYGTLGVPAAGNVPGGRQPGAGWTDNSGHLWVFGGYASDANGNLGNLNDLWEFNSSTNEWAWMSGSNLVGSNGGQPGVYGTLGVPAPGNVPGSRAGASSWTDSNGNLWLFGGVGVDASGNTGYLDDLWEFNPSTKLWTWMGGNNLAGRPGVYGTLGVPAAGNVPDGRSSVAHWRDNQGNFWLLGGADGQSYIYWGDFNDFWEYQPSSTPSFTAAATPVFSPSAGLYSSASVTITDALPGAAIYYTIDGVTAPTTSSTLYNGTITVSATETVQAIAVASNYFNSAVASATYNIAPPAATPAFSVAAGSYTSTQTVTISDVSAGAPIYYTADGTTPSTSSTVYSGPVIVSSSETLEAIAIGGGFSASAVGSAIYTIPPDFTVAVNPATVSLQAGQSGTTTITMQDEGGFNGNVAFACSGLPAGDTCSFSTLAVPTPAGVTYSTLTVNTAANTSAIHRNSGPLFPGSVLAIAFCFLGWKKRRRWQMVALLAVSAGALGLFIGCNASSTPVQPVTTTVTVTATSGALSHTISFSLTVN